MFDLTLSNYFIMDKIYLAVAIISEVIATISLKSSSGFTKITPSIIVVLGYVIAFYFLSLVLKTMDSATAYAIWSGMGIMLLVVYVSIMNKQLPDIATIMGVVLIIGGIFILNISTKETLH